MTMETTEIAVAAPQHNKMALLRPVASPKELIEAHKEATILIREALEDGVDYGVLPGSDPKKSKKILFKPGSERLLKAFACVPKFTVIEKEVNHDHEFKWNKRKWDYGARKHVTEEGIAFGIYRYVIKCEIFTYDGLLVGEGLGSCSTMESKYTDRPRDLENTVLKMAKKRAQVDGVLNALGLSDRFDQDEEEIEVQSERAQVASENADPEGFDPANTGHHDWLVRQMKAQKVPEDKWAAVGDALKGKPGPQALAWAVKTALGQK